MRGQTTLDFAIGVTIFLVVILFVFGFVPGILEPFNVSGEEEPALSNRIADSLVEDKLTDNREPYVLDRYCAVEFFNGTAPADCNYDGTTLEGQFNLSSTQRANVTILGNLTGGMESETLCWDGDNNNTLTTVDDSDCTHGSTDDVRLSLGDVPPDDQGTTITARRVVSLFGESVTLRVIVW